MRVVAGDAGDPPVTGCSPAAALLKAIGLKAYFRETDLAISFDHIRPSAVTGPAKVDGIRRGKIGGIHDCRRLFRVVAGHGRDVGSGGSVTRFAGNSRNSFLRIKHVGNDSRSGVTSEATRCFIGAQFPPESAFQALGQIAGLSWGNVECVELCEKTQAALEVDSVLLEDVGLPLLESHGPDRWR